MRGVYVGILLLLRTMMSTVWCFLQDESGDGGSDDGANGDGGDGGDGDASDWSADREDNPTTKKKKVFTSHCIEACDESLYLAFLVHRCTNLTLSDHKTQNTRIVVKNFQLALAVVHSG